jgi:hypothetical protein
MRCNARRTVVGPAIVVVLGALLGVGADVAAAPVAEACTYGPYSYSMDAEVPVWYWGVHHFGSFYANPDAGCGVRFKVQGQRKVCGFWGCSYETKADSGFVQPNGTRTRLYTAQYCIAGTHRYRTRSYATNLGGPYYYDASVLSTTPEFTC